MNLTNYDYTQLPMPESISPKPEWNILDPSKLTVFDACPREFFYSHILGWRRDTVNKHFVFGTAWHLAMEHLAWNGFESEEVEKAYQKFLIYYRKFYSEDTDLDMAPKNPSNAKLALAEYAVTYGDRDTRDYKTLHTEIFVRVPINDSGRLMCGRMDRIQRHYERGIEGLDHKTGSKRTPSWEDEWKLSVQMEFYYHVLNIAYPEEKIFGMMVDGMFFYKRTQTGELTKNLPVRVPIRKDNDMHQAFLSDINITFDLLDWNMEGLSKASPDDTVLSAFPRKTKNCVNRYGHLCPFHSFCMTWANPLKFCAEPPLDYKVEHWNPQAPGEKPPPKEVFSPEKGFEKSQEEGA